MKDTYEEFMVQKGTVKKTLHFSALQGGLEKEREREHICLCGLP